MISFLKEFVKLIQLFDQTSRFTNMNARLGIAFLLCFGLCVQLITSASIDKQEHKLRQLKVLEGQACQISADCCPEGESCNASCYNAKCYSDREFGESCEITHQCRKMLGAKCLDDKVCGCDADWVKKPSGCFDVDVCLVDEDCSYDKSNRTCNAERKLCLTPKPSASEPKKLGGGAIAGIVIGVLFIVGIIGFFGYKKFSSR